MQLNDVNWKVKKKVWRNGAMASVTVDMDIEGHVHVRVM
jgi:hypothetical protein